MATRRTRSMTWFVLTLWLYTKLIESEETKIVDNMTLNLSRLRNIAFLPESNEKRKSYHVSPGVVDAAVEEARNKLETENTLLVRMMEKYPSSTNALSSGCPALNRHHRRMTANPKISAMENITKLLEFTTIALANRLGVANKDIPNLELDGTKLQNIKEQVVERSADTKCDKRTKFRTIDGSCNNVKHHDWGSALNCMNRILPPDYADGVSNPRKASSGNELPNPRLVSTTIHFEKDVPAGDFTHLLMQWGHFLSHDITFTPSRSFPRGDVALALRKIIDCCAPEDRHNSQCFPFAIPPDDPFFTHYNIRCMDFRRSARCLRSGPGQREQINQITSFIDGSQIYGSFLNISLAIRTFQNGLLKTQTDNQGGEILPGSPNAESDFCSDVANNNICFMAGDIRVNQQPGLTSMHIIWLRQHNRLARQLKQLNPSWDDETLYQEARRIVGAQLQMITYNEFLPVVLGPLFYLTFHLKPLSSGYTSYLKEKDPTILNEFSTAAFRFGHTLIQNNFSQIYSSNNSSNMELQDNFFFPFELYYGQLDSILRGLMKDKGQEFDTFFSNSVTNHLFKRRGEEHGLDIAALNIQRGRDHGLRSYVDYLEYCFLKHLTKFHHLQLTMTKDAQNHFENLYEKVEDIDLFSGGVNERPLNKGIVGPTFGCIIGVQFGLLKFGDRYYFEHGKQSGSFTPDQLREIRKTTLARILCDNSDGFQSISRFPFRPENFERNEVINCNDLPEINLELW
ncbi:peroxidase-like isoform X2 [Limulus polyphemus]|nr:peroxidase-like isoform X2 [Limulus polyphemus]